VLTPIKKRDCLAPSEKMKENRDIPEITDRRSKDRRNPQKGCLRRQNFNSKSGSVNKQFHSIISAKQPFKKALKNKKNETFIFEKKYCSKYCNCLCPQKHPSKAMSYRPCYMTQTGLTIVTVETQGGGCSFYHAFFHVDFCFADSVIKFVTRFRIGICTL
jgi:hypothetical protein